MNTIRIKCPVCGAVLVAKDDPNNAGKYVSCPNCHEKRKFMEFKKIPLNSKYQDDETDVTELNSKKDTTPGRLLDRKTGMSYALSEGKHIVGRKPLKSAPKADIPIVTNDLGMSRAHVKLKIALARDGRYHVYVSNAENLNPTYINGELLKEGDEVGIKHGDILKLCETELVFIGSTIEEETELKSIRK